MPRYGKIHSMPAALQNAASELLDAGKTEQQVAEWLNETLAKAQIKGLEPDVNQPNVSAWKNSGFRRWKENQRAKELAQRITAISETADPTTPDTADKLAAALIAELTIELAVVKENYEPGEERTKRLLMIVGGLVQLRRTNQAKGWLKIEVAKTKMSLTRFQHETGEQINPLDDIPGRRDGGISAEAMEDIDCLLGTIDDKDHEYKTLSKQEVNQSKEQLQQALANL
jgi:hypothetical protein